MLRLLAALAVTTLYVGAQTLPASWTPPVQNCLEQPDWTVRQYDESLFILRESGCLDYEKPFVYLILSSSTRALLLDTGAGRDPKLGPALEALFEKRGARPSELIVLHSHAHRDHTAGDAQLAAMPGVRIIPAKPEAIAAAAGMQSWPDTPGAIDLGGGRILDILAIPGHEPASIAVYDRRTGILLTGDTLYPGRLYVSDWPAFCASIARLTAFASTLPVAHILGAHIGQTSTPFLDYPTGTTHQPNEHALALSFGTLLELNAALTKAGAEPQTIRTRDFTVVPRKPRAP